MPDGGKLTPISPGVLARARQAARYVISGVSPATWFGPMQPVQPVAPPEVAGRRFDYPTGYNLNYTHKDHGPVSFQELKALADNCDILRAVIETRKDQMEALDWNIRLKADDERKRPNPTGEQQRRIDAITAFFQSPDRQNSWEQWLRQWLEQMFVLDAACLYRRPNRKGTLYGLEVLDGETIKILLDDAGRRPLPPSPAYQQILHGVPACDYTSDELLYLMHNPRAHKVYGYGHVEQVLMTVNTQIRRALSQLEYFRSGSLPDYFVQMPESWTMEQIETYERWFTATYAGNLAQRRSGVMLPAGADPKEVKPPALKDEYDEWLARVICYVFSVPPTPFIKQMNRATADNAHDAALEEGLAPLQKYVRNNLNRILAADFGSPDLEFAWVDDREQDPQTAATIREGDVKCGIISIDEARETIGLDPLGDAYAVPMAYTATGYVAIKSPDEQAADSQAQQESQLAAARAKPMGGQEGNPDKPPNAAKLSKGVKKKSSNPYLSIGHSHAGP